MDKKIIFLTIMLFISNFAQANQTVWHLTIDEKFNLPHVTLNIAGKDTVLTLDTGSRSGLHLPIELIDKLPNKIEQSEKIKSIDLAGNVTETRTFIVNDLILGSLLFNKIELLEYKKWGIEFSASNDDKGIDDDKEDIVTNAVIGLDLFDNYVLTLNFPENKIILSDPNKVSTDLDEKWISIPFHLNEEGIVINMSDGINRYKMVLDSASSMSVIKTQSLAPQTVKIDDENHQFVALEASDVATHKIEALIFDSLPAEFQSDGLLGVDFLTKHLVKIDFKNQKLWIKTIFD